MSTKSSADGLSGAGRQFLERRTFFANAAASLGSIALTSLLSRDDLLAGHLTNRTGVELQDCVLMHGNLAYALPNLANGAVATTL